MAVERMMTVIISSAQLTVGSAYVVAMYAVIMSIAPAATTWLVVACKVSKHLLLRDCHSRLKTMMLIVYWGSVCD